MAHKSAPKTQARGFVSLLIASLTALVPLVAHAQTKTTSQSYGPLAARRLQIAPAGNVNTPLFLPAVTYGTGGTEATFVTVADVNSDGKPDLLVANTYYSNTIGVLLGNGDGTFQTAVTYPSGGGFPATIVPVDLNGDRKMDLVVANQSTCYACSGNGVVAVLMGNGDGSFQPAVTYDSGGLGFANNGLGPAEVAVSDLNGDGKLDIVVTNCAASSATGCGDGDGFIGVLFGNGDGTFQSALSYDSGVSHPGTALALADLNGDGNPDLILAAPPSSVAVLLGRGDGTFRAPVFYGSGGVNVQEIVAADLKGNGKLDLAVAGCTALDCFTSGGIAGVLLGNGDGTFQKSVAYDTGGRLADGLAVADVNGDGKLDVVAANVLDFSVGVLLGNGDGTVQPALTYPSGGNLTYSVVAHDVNGDRKPDLLVSSCAVGSFCGGTDGVVGVLLNNTQFCTTPPVITLSTTPTSLWPPNGEMVPVTVSGRITDSGCSATSASYAVIDEYGEIQPSGPVTLSAAAYSFTVLLPASRLGTDLDGRLYTITVSASNNAGKTESQVGAVIVPHDRRY